MTGIVYLLTNPAMPGIVKIGKTTNENPQVRIDQLYTTGVPVPFECALAVKVPDESKIEEALHIAFGPYRINPRREFFKIETEQAVVILRLIGSEDVTPSVNAENEATMDKIDKESREKLSRSRRPNLHFEEMGIPIGSLIQCLRTEEFATVVGPKKVEFRGKECSLTQATRIAHDLNDGYAIAPNPNWIFEGRILSDIYNDTYSYPE